MNRFRWALVAALLAAPLAAAQEFQPGPAPRPGLLFHATFDNGPRADAGTGWMEMHYSGSYRHNPRHEFRFVEGRLGKAVNLRPGRDDVEFACFKMPGHVCAPVGTLAFWFRTDGPAPALRLETQSNDFWVMIRLLDISGRPGSPINVSAVGRDYAATTIAIDNKTWADDKWRHLAIVWDETQGLRGYLDGKETGSSWGKAPFHRGYLSAGRLAIAGAEFDDLRVYDAALPAEAIQALAQGREPAAPAPAAEAAQTHRLEALSWDNAPASQFVPASGPTRIRLADLSDARALRKSGWRSVDGRHDSAWPIYYHSYAWLSGGNLHLTLQPGERFNFVRAVGRLNLSSLCEGAALERPATARTLLDFEGERFVRGFPLPTECAAPAVSVYKSVGRDKLLTDRRMLNDLALLHVSSGTARDPELAVFHLAPSQPRAFSGGARVRLIQWYRPEERGVLAAAAQPTPGKAPAPALRYVHLMTAPQSEDTPLSAARLVLRAEGWQAGNLVNVRVHDPFNLWRALADVDLRVEKAGELDVTFEFPATILPAGVELWLTVISRDTGQILCGPGASRIAIHGPAMDKARASYLAWQHRLLKDNFAIISEPRPWFNNETDTPLRVASGCYDAIARVMLDLYERFPTDRWTLGYMSYTRPKTVFFSKLPMPELPADPAAPRWALLQKELFKQFLGFAHWWVDEQGVPNGELGSSVQDDTDLVQDWPGLLLRHDPDAKLRNNLMALNETAWTRNIRNGLNITSHSYRHSYEEGLNVTPLAALLDYGNPVLMERLLATARRYTEVYPLKNGKRYPVKGYLSTDNIPREIGGGGPGDTGRLWHPGTQLVWYNGCRALTNMMAQFFDGFDGKWQPQYMDIPHLLWLQTGDARFKRSFWEEVVKAAPDPTWVRLENRALPANTPLEKVVPAWGLGSLAGTDLLGFGDYEPLRFSYNSWHFSRDKKYLEAPMERMWKQNHYAMPLWTWTGQSGDRVSPHRILNDYMLFGGVPAMREHIIPNLAVSYEGFSLEMAALVVDDTPELLRWTGFSFEPKPLAGRLRVWRLAPGVYDVRMGADENNDDRVDGDAPAVRMALKRFDTISVTLPSRKPFVVEAVLVEKDTPLHDRCDLAVTAMDAVRKDASLTVTAHNLGRVPTGPFEVILKDAQGRELGRQKHNGLDGIEDLLDKKAAFVFESAPAGALAVELVGPGKEITEVNNRAVIPAP